MAYFDKKGTFHGTVEEMQQEVLEAVRSMTPEEKAIMRQNLEKMLLKPTAGSESDQPEARKQTEVLESIEDQIE